MPLAAPWYTNETLWAALGVAVGVIAIIVGAVVARRVANPRRRLLYSMPTVTPLLGSSPLVAPGTLEVRHDGETLSAPHVVEVQLVCQGRQDIPTSAFDGGRPLRLDVGGRVVGVLQVESKPDSTQCPPWTVTDSGVELGPGLIKRNQTITIALLVDHPDPRLSCPHPPLVDVDVVARAGQLGSPDRVGLARAASLASLAVLLVLVGSSVSVMLNDSLQTATSDAVREAAIRDGRAGNHAVPTNPACCPPATNPAGDQDQRGLAVCPGSR